MLIGLLRKLMLMATARVSDETYRPERHYMRGPGPKTRAKAFATFGMTKGGAPEGAADEPGHRL